MSNNRNVTYLEFEVALSRRFRKSSEVFAFRSDAPFTFDKPWGLQSLPAGSWVLIPVRDGHPTGDLYGCEHEVFVQTYRASRSGLPHTFEKVAEVRAYQPGFAFAVRTIVGGFVEVPENAAGPADWIVRNPGGEVYTISDAEFRVTYVEVRELD